MSKTKKFFTLKYFLTVLTVSILLSAAFLFLANDAFAITAGTQDVTVNIPLGASQKQVGQILKENGLIKSRLWFDTYLALRGKKLSVNGTDFVINKGSGFDGIYRTLALGKKEKRTEKRVVIPEGSTVEDIMKIICDDHGIVTRQELTDVIQNGDFSKYDFVSAITGNAENRKYRLEGYLYPDTYYFYSDTGAYDIIDRMLGNFDTKFDKRYRAACKKQGMSIDEAVTLASMVIAEAKNISDYPKISSVFHNRLNSYRFSKRLDCDATLVYVLGREMMPSDKDNSSRYNTYKYGGLPPSAIANPDLNAISYAIYPDSTGYYYFVTRRDGKVLYASDYQTHLRNIRLAGSS